MLPTPPGWERAGNGPASAAGVFLLLVLALWSKIRPGPLRPLFVACVVAAAVPAALAQRDGSGAGTSAAGWLVVPAARGRILLGCLALLPLSAAAGVAGWGIWSPGVGLALGGLAGTANVWTLAAQEPWRGEVRLTPAGVSHTRGRNRHTAAWDHITDVTATLRQLTTRGMRVRHRHIEVRTSGRTKLVLTVAELDADPVTLYWLLRYYLAHPDDRGELADGRALARAERGEIVVEQAPLPPLPPVPPAPAPGC